MTSLSLSGPQGYAQARIEASYGHRDGISSASSSSPSSSFVRTVEQRPYFPLLEVDPSNEATVIQVAKVVVSCRNNHANNNNDNGISTTTNGAVPNEGEEGSSSVTVLTGGLTNTLFKVDLPDDDYAPLNCVLVRLFGSEGMIDRDQETAHYARLCNAGGALHDKLDLVGRFGNGRVETFLPNMRVAHHIDDFGREEGLSLEIARQLARLHYSYEPDSDAAAETRTKSSPQQQPTLWKVIESWIEELSQHLSHEKYREDASLMELFSRAITSHPVESSSSKPQSYMAADAIKDALSNELVWLKNEVETRFPHAPIVFCHNDVNAGNVLLDASIDHTCEESESVGKSSSTPYDRRSVCIIDYEYGSTNYAMYDVANYACEHCGGNDNGVPDYGLLPDSQRMADFLREYVRERDGIALTKGRVDADDCANASEVNEGEVSDLLSQVELFQMASNLYWGIWGVLQAAGEVVDGTFTMENAASRLEGESDLSTWDNLRYGRNRLARFHVCRRELLGNSS